MDAVKEQAVQHKKSLTDFRKRTRSSSNPARPSIRILDNLSRLICPSVRSLLHVGFNAFLAGAAKFQRWVASESLGEPSKLLGRCQRGY